MRCTAALLFYPRGRKQKALYVENGCHFLVKATAPTHSAHRWASGPQLG